MKKAVFLAAIAASFILLPGASVWEGTATIGGEFSETGLFAATNSFPVNTLVDVTNLENGKTIKLKVASSLGGSGLLAILSKDAGGAIGFLDGGTGKIRMSESEDQTLTSGMSPDRNFSPGEPVESQPKEALTAINPPYELAIVQAEERPPVDNTGIDPSYFIQQTPGGVPADTKTSNVITTNTIPPTVNTPAPNTDLPAAQSSAIKRYSPSGVPLITSLEKGKYYLQLGSFRKAETAEAEILKIGDNLPLAIMSAEVNGSSVYRVLIGPVGLGECGALRDRYKSIYSDAFVRQGL